MLYQECNELTKEELIFKALAFLNYRFFRVCLFSVLTALVARIELRHAQGN
jgi:hypothetical protein